eukprot:3292538-Pleurochrysis_carterae.AAC.1
MPAIYSRAMMHVLQVLQDVDLAQKLDKHGQVAAPHLKLVRRGVRQLVATTSPSPRAKPRRALVLKGIVKCWDACLKD